MKKNLADIILNIVVGAIVYGAFYGIPLIMLVVFLADEFIH